MPQESDSPKKPRRKQSKSTVDDISKQLDDALTNFLKKQASTKNKTLNNYKSLENLLDQYLNSFILIGYTQDTKKFVSIVNAKNEQHADSLSTALNKFIINNTQVRNIPPDTY